MRQVRARNAPDHPGEFDLVMFSRVLADWSPEDLQKILATNAAKYGAYSCGGALDVRWTVDASAPGAPVAPAGAAWI